MHININDHMSDILKVCTVLVVISGAYFAVDNKTENNHLSIVRLEDKINKIDSETHSRQELDLMIKILNSEITKLNASIETLRETVDKIRFGNIEKGK